MGEGVLGPFFGWEIRSVTGGRWGRTVRHLDSPNPRGPRGNKQGGLIAYLHDLLNCNTLLTGVKRKMKIFLPAKHAKRDKRGIDLS